MIVISFFIGILSTFSLFIYILALFLFVFGEGDYVGAIAYAPKWIFILSPLIFLGRRKEVQHFLSRL